MASDNQVSSILLLILIGLAIYFLLNPEGFIGKSQYEQFFGKSQTEQFNDVVGVNPENNFGTTNNQSYEAQPSTNGSLPEPDQAPEPVYVQEPDQIQESAQVQALDSSIPYVSQNVLTEIINEAPIQKQTLFEPKNNTPIVQQPHISAKSPEYHNKRIVYHPKNKKVSSQMPSSQMPNVSSEEEYIASQMVYNPNIKLDANDLNSVANFDPNDEEYDYGASDLTAAFMPPLPPGTKPDMVDFKKNNVDKYNAKDFLPKQVNDEWFETDFSLAKYQLNDDKLINTEKYIIGINTVGESLKNASYDIRGTIPNPKFIVSPWNNTTYEPDFNLKPLC